MVELFNLSSYCQLLGDTRSDECYIFTQIDGRTTAGSTQTPRSIDHQEATRRRIARTGSSSLHHLVSWSVISVDLAAARFNQPGLGRKETATLGTDDIMIHFVGSGCLGSQQPRTL